MNDDPKNPSALLMLGRALTAQAKYSEALTTLRSSIAVSPNTFPANSLLGTVYLRQGSFGLAENALLQALRFVTPLEKRGLAQQFESLGDGYMKAQNILGGERSYRQAVALDPENQALANKLAGFPKK